MLRVVLVAGSVAGAWFAAQHTGRSKGAQAQPKRKLKTVRAQRGHSSNGASGPSAASEPGPTNNSAPDAGSSGSPAAGAAAPWGGSLLVATLLLLVHTALLSIYTLVLQRVNFTRQPVLTVVVATVAGLVALSSLLSAWRALCAALVTRSRHTRHRQASSAAAATSEPSLALAGVTAAAPRQDLSGTWLKDKASSDSMDEAFDVIHLGRLIRTAVGLIKGLQLQQDEEQFRMSVLSGILWFKITEAYPMDGSPRLFRRRDLRRGRHTGTVVSSPTSGGIYMRATWDAPYGGTVVDHFWLPEPDVLYVDTSMQVDDRKVEYRTVYRRAK